MIERIGKRLLTLLALLLGLGGFSMTFAGAAMADRVATTNTLERDLEPVVITGTEVSAFDGVPLDELLVFATTDGVWTETPFQVDEVTVAGDYTAAEDGLLDGNDEIVIMAIDLGDQTGIPMVNSQPVGDRWYEIEVTNPISPTQKGWAYLVHSTTLTTTFTADYVDFDTDLRRVRADSYDLGFGTTHPFYEYLALNGSDVDIVDRYKLRLFCSVPVICPVTENNLGFGAPPDDLIKDGPVRVIVRGGDVLAYGSMLTWTANINIFGFLGGSMYLATDFDTAASGATYYNAVVPEGVTVDGRADSIPLQPLSSWWQLSHETGTLIQVTDTAPIGGIQSNYYRDELRKDSEDTGDGRRFGETGVFVVRPELTFTYPFTFYVLPGEQPNLGETYAANFSQPVAVAAQLHELAAPVYLPVLRR